MGMKENIFNSSKSSNQNSIMIFAPHPDDETLGCAGEIIKAIELGETVKVVVITNGDGFAKAASVNSGKNIIDLLPDDFLEVARLRQEGALAATNVLGLKSEDIYFLSYPDGGLASMRNLTGNIPFIQAHTKKSQTYGLDFPDYHTLKHRMPAPYLWSMALKDISELLQTFRPKRIYITDEADGHSDHQAAYHLVCEAALMANFEGEIYTYLIHSVSGTWPWPRGASPEKPYGLHIEDGLQIPNGIDWPPQIRCPLTPAMVAIKTLAIHKYELEMNLCGEYIESFIKSEEIFWQRNL